MKTTSYRQIAMTLGGVLIAIVAAGCYGGGGSGYSNNPYGYNSGYSSSYPYSGYNGGYSSQRSYGNSYNAGYQNAVRADANRDRHEDHVSDQHATVANRESAVARTETSHSRADHTEKN